MYRKPVTRAFSLLLSVLMFLCSYMAVPAEVLAEGLAVREAVRTYNEANDFSSNTAMEYSALVGEEEELRGEATRTFRRGDGMKEAVVYSEPVAYETEGGYALIDNTLVRTEEGYTNKANSLKAAFAEDTEKEELVRLEAGGSLLSWFLGGFHLGEAPEEVTAEEAVPE